MKLGLISKRNPGKLNTDGIAQLHGTEFVVADVDTREELTNQAGMIWTPGSLLMQPLKEGLFTKEHFDPEKDYLVVVVECSGAIGEST